MCLIVSNCICVSAQAAASHDPADISGLLGSESGPVHGEVLHHSVSVLVLHTGKLRLPTSGVYLMCALVVTYTGTE